MTSGACRSAGPSKYPGPVSLLGRKKATESEPAEEVVESASDTTAGAARRTTTAPKGKPTPKRDAAKRKGPVAPAPMTSAEARKRRKELGGPKLSKEERRAERADRKQDMANRREKMMAGDEDYLLPRDRGPVRRYVRDVVDSRPHLLGLFMPMALLVVFGMLAVPQLSYYSSYVMLGMVFVMVIDGVLLGRKVNRLVDDKFPDNTETGFKLGFYAASRASQLRRMRAPRARVSRGARLS